MRFLRLPSSSPVHSGLLAHLVRCIPLYIMTHAQTCVTCKHSTIILTTSQCDDLLLMMLWGADGGTECMFRDEGHDSIVTRMYRVVRHLLPSPVHLQSQGCVSLMQYRMTKRHEPCVECGKGAPGGIAPACSPPAIVPTCPPGRMHQCLYIMIADNYSDTIGRPSETPHVTLAGTIRHSIRMRYQNPHTQHARNL